MIKFHVWFIRGNSFRYKNMKNIVRHRLEFNICSSLKIFKFITLERQTIGKFMRNDNKSG